MVWKCSLPLLMLVVLTALGCGGISQDDLRAHALPNDEEEPAAAPAAEKPAETPPAAVPTTESTPAAEQPAAVAAAAARPGEPATKHPENTAVAQNQEPKQPATTEDKVAAVPVEDFASLPTAPSRSSDSSTTSGSTETAAEPAAEEDVLGPMPVLSSEPTSEESEALRQWFLKRQMLESQIEQRAEEAAKKRAEAERAKQLATPDSAGDVLAMAGESAGHSGEMLQALFDRLTNPENLAPVELARVAQELAYSGATREALAYYHGWALTTDETDELKKQFGWSAALQRPLGAIHWGLGIQYEGAPQLANNADPIGRDGSVFVNASRQPPSSNLQTYVGELGERLLFGLDGKLETGVFGKLLKPPRENQEHPRTIALQWQIKPAGFKPESLGRGITLLGGGTRKELSYISKHEGIDVLVIFDMNVKQPRTGPVINITTVKLVDAARNKDLVSSPALNNIKVKMARQDRTQKDPVEKAYEDLFAFIDASVQLGEFPANLKEEHAKARIEALAATEPPNPLGVMAEMRIYHARGLVGDATLYAAYKTLIGDGPAKKLITGSSAERVGAISQYLPRIQPVK